MHVRVTGLARVGDSVTELGRYLRGTRRKKYPRALFLCTGVSFFWGLVFAAAGFEAHGLAVFVHHHARVHAGGVHGGLATYY